MIFTFLFQVLHHLAYISDALGSFVCFSLCCTSSLNLQSNQLNKRFYVADITEACWKFIPVGINMTVTKGHEAKP